jgi:thiamine biosynthesis lipoprotein
VTEIGPIRHVEHCMGTVFSIELRERIDAGDFAAALQRLHWVDSTFSTYRDDSQISRLDRGEITLAQCAPEVGAVLARCARLRTDTEGYFDAHASGRLDPSGVVKGWAIEALHQALRRAGSGWHCINGGGDIRCAGGRGRPWRLGIAHPLVPGELVTVVEGADFALATSGTAERGAHILDPHTGRAPSALASISLVGADLTVVDAYATAAFAMGAAARAWLTAQAGIEALAVTERGEVWSTAGFPVAGQPEKRTSRRT